jgi:TatD DNase family protein
MIDFHCHLDLYPKALSILPEVVRKNEFTLVVTTSPRAWLATSKVFSDYNNIHVALGMHPEVIESKSNEQKLLLSSIAEAKFIGEIGIDGSSRYLNTIHMQETLFCDVLKECEYNGGRIMSIHSRNAVGLVLDILRCFCRTSIPVLHWFTGTSKELKCAIDLGCWFSVGPAMFAGPKGRKFIEQIPHDRLLPETDGPFAQIKSHPIMPWQSMEVVNKLADLWEEDHINVEQQMRRNLSTILNQGQK